MNVFSLIRVKWSNEHIIAAVFFVLVLYHLPQWSKNPAGIASFLLLVAEGLLIDCIASLLRYKRVWCCVSAAVTAAMISALTNGIPLWGQMLGVAVALLLGKQLWGGTGKNIVNPAMVGLLFLLLFFDVPYPFFAASYLLIPAVILSLPFLKIRPFAGIGFILGMVASMIFVGDLTLMNLLSYGVFFWGCIVMTDPVTVGNHPMIGSVVGFLAGFAALFQYQEPIVLVILILAINLFSFTMEGFISKNVKFLKPKLMIPKAIPFIKDQAKMVDLTVGNGLLTSEKNGRVESLSERGKDKLESSVEPGKDRLESPNKSDLEISSVDESDIFKLSEKEILNRIKTNEVFGMGGAAFSTYQKLITVLTAKESQKYFIINGVECDPGLIHDHWLLYNHSKEIGIGVELLQKCIGFTSIYLAVKDTEGIELPDQIQIAKVPEDYPIGAEKILIARILAKQIASDQIPAVCGILVLNVQTLYAIYQAVYSNKPVDTRYLTVANLKEKSAKVVKVRLGMKIHEVMEAVYPGVINVFAGGGLMQSYLADEDEVVGKNVNFIATSLFPKYKESPQCSKCGNCSSSCPVGLKVNLIADLVDTGKVNETEKYHVRECISCGSCSYSCLAGRNLASRVKIAKETFK